MTSHVAAPSATYQATLNLNYDAVTSLRALIVICHTWRAPRLGIEQFYRPIMKQWLYPLP